MKATVQFDISSKTLGTPDQIKAVFTKMLFMFVNAYGGEDPIHVSQPQVSVKAEDQTEE